MHKKTFVWPVARLCLVFSDKVCAFLCFLCSRPQLPPCVYAVALIIHLPSKSHNFYKDNLELQYTLWGTSKMNEIIHLRRALDLQRAYNSRYAMFSIFGLLDKSFQRKFRCLYWFWKRVCIQVKWNMWNIKQSFSFISLNHNSKQPDFIPVLLSLLYNPALNSALTPASDLLPFPSVQQKSLISQLPFKLKLLQIRRSFLWLVLNLFSFFQGAFQNLDVKESHSQKNLEWF